ncbi:uncharacterized protein LOC135695329 [Rhopilema esculentum]|uniref:uncharacterized protein LOC135695329 n=1 Tax=Rhopilema esculentum TaxID=499914 RepID=UPI0031D55E00
MGKILLFLFVTCTLVQLSTQFWPSRKKEVKKALWDQLSIKLPGLFGGSQKLPITVDAAKKKSWRKTDNKKCDGHKLFRGNRYRYESEYGTMLLFDSNGHIAGMQVAVPTSVPMVEKRKYMLPIENGRYHLTVYFQDPSTICNAPKRSDGGIGDKFFIQVGETWEKTMKVPINKDDLKSTMWVEGKCITNYGHFFWYDISKKMDCEKFFPVFLTYSNKGKLNGFGWTLKGYFDDPKFDHPDPRWASFAFQSKSMPDCVATATTRGSTQQVFLQSSYSSYTCTNFWG